MTAPHGVITKLTRQSSYLGESSELGKIGLDEILERSLTVTFVFFVFTLFFIAVMLLVPIGAIAYAG